MAADFAQFEQEYGSKLHIVKVNCDKPDKVQLYRKYKESGYIPETVVLKNDKVVFRKVGAMSMGALVLAVKESVAQ